MTLPTEPDRSSFARRLATVVAAGRAWIGRVAGESGATTGAAGGAVSLSRERRSARICK